MTVEVYVEMEGHRHKDGTVHTKTYIEASGKGQYEIELAAKTGAFVGGLGTMGLANALEGNKASNLNLDVEYRKSITSGNSG